MGKTKGGKKEKRVMEDQDRPKPLTKKERKEKRKQKKLARLERSKART